MKKTICIIIALLMIFASCPALADSFSLRGGIEFGDTVEEVKEKETAAFAEEGSDYLKTGSITLATIEDANIKYYFSDEGLLTDILYDFRSTKSKDTASDNFSTLYDGLTRKYGKPINTDSDSMYIIIGKAFETAAESVAVRLWLDGSADILSHSEWVKDYKKFNVKIDLVEYYIETQNALSYCYKISYKYFTDADLKAAKEEQAQRLAEIDNDL